MLLDVIVEYLLQSNSSLTSPAGIATTTHKEFSWPLQLIVVLFPNILIYFNIIQTGLIPLVMYFQHTCTILLQEYRIQRLSSFQQMVENKDFRKFYILLILTCISSCLYNLTTSTHLYIPYPQVIKGITVFLTLTYHSMIIYGTIDLIKESLKSTCILRDVKSAKIIFIANLMVLLIAAFIPFIDLSFYGHEHILFPVDLHDNVYLEILLIISTTIIFLLRNYENRLIIDGYRVS